MKIGLLGQFGTGNTGNEGSLEAMLSFLRASRADAELLCICSNPQVVSERHHVQAISIGGAFAMSRWFERLNGVFRDIPRKMLTLWVIFTRLRGFDLLIIPGTGILDDFQETAFGWPFVIFRWCLAARLHRVPVAFISIGAGPIEHPLSRFFLKSAARMAKYRSYRDGVSRDFMKSIGFDVSRDRLTADLAFGLPVVAEFERASDGPMCVGVGVMSYSGWTKLGDQGETIYRTYLGKMAEFISWLVERGLTVRLLTGDAVDRRALSDLTSMLGSHLDAKGNPSVVAEEMTSLHDVMTQIAHTDIVVATRFHNVVCALQMGRPVISLGYAEKNDELLRATGLSQYCHHVETFDVEVLKRQFDTVLANRQRLSFEVKRGVAAFHAQLAEQEAVIRTMFLDVDAQPSGEVVEEVEAGQL